MNNGIQIFDPALIRRRHARALPRLADHSFLIDRAAAALADRLGDIRRDFPVAVLNGLRISAEARQTLESAIRAQSIYRTDSVPGLSPDILCDPEILPFANGSLDLYASNFALHNTNDLPGALIQIRRALKPDGLFLAAMPGGETLFELRAALQQAEMEVKGGLSPRIHPFATKQDMGALLQRAGFALPVVDSETLTITYENLFRLLAELRGMGSGNALLARHKANPGRSLFLRAAEIYARDYAEKSGSGRIEASVEIIYLIGWAPHDAQQKPLRPGSAQTRLADALGTRETKLP